MNEKRKTLVAIILTALLASVVTLAGSEFLNRKREAGNIEENSTVFSGVSSSRRISSAGNPDFVRAAAAVTPAVVHLKTQFVQESRSDPFEQLFGAPSSGRVAMSSGSGVIITTDGYILTNNHVVENASQIEVVLTDRRTFKADVVGTDPTTDLALVKVKGKDLPVLPMGNSDVVAVGEWVLAVGYPLSLNSTVTAGIVSAKGRSIGILDQPASDRRQGGSSAIESFIQTDAAINPGNSGGALVNTNGELIGINAAIASQTGSYTGYGFAIPVNLAKKIVADFREFGEVRRGYLGVSFPSPAVEDQLLKEQGINPGTLNGVYITGVQDGGAAAEAGLKAGDVIQSIDGTKLGSSAEFSERIARHRPGDQVKLSYIRGGKTQEVTLTLKGRSELSASRGKAPGMDLQERLGASFAPLDESVKRRFGLRSGLVITAIKRGGFFDEAGLPPGTIIIRVNARPVNSLEEFNEAVRLSRNGNARIEGLTPRGAGFVFNFPFGA